MGKPVILSVLLLMSGLATRADAPAPVHPIRVCEILADIAAWRGKTAAVIGRYSFRDDGRFLSEDACESRPSSGSFAWPTSMQLAVEADGPRLPDQFDIDPGEAGRKLRLTRKSTSLGKFRFGSLEYDRWAIVYGRIETSKDFDAPPPSLKPVKAGLEPAPLRLVYRGDGMIFFIAAE